MQVGNCGSRWRPGKAGWCSATGWGPAQVHRWAFLLDLEDPTRVRGGLREPLLYPDGAERDGYVPNVLYSCGSQVHGDNLIIPYAMSDWASTFAAVDLPQLLDELLAS